jgi:hypothetical protein
MAICETPQVEGENHETDYCYLSGLILLEPLAGAGEIIHDDEYNYIKTQFENFIHHLFPLGGIDEKNDFRSHNHRTVCHFQCGTGG